MGEGAGGGEQLYLTLYPPHLNPLPRGERDGVRGSGFWLLEFRSLFGDWCLEIGYWLFVDLLFFSFEVRRISFHIPYLTLPVQCFFVELVLDEEIHDFIRSGPDHL